MKFFYNAYLILLLSISLSGAVNAQKVPYTEDNQTVIATTEEVKNGCRTAFSLSEALGNAQQTTIYKNVVLPTALPGSSDSRDVSADGALRGVAGLLQRITNGLTTVAAAVAVFFIVFNSGGLLLAAGDTEAIKKARNGIIWALLGLLLIMGSYIIAKTAISITYSGSYKTEGQNRLDMHCDDHGSGAGGEDEESTEGGAADAEAEAEACPAPPRIPSACYQGTDLTDQSGIGGPGRTCDEQINSNNSLGEICEDLGISGSCTIRAVQGRIDYSRLDSTYPSECRRNNDGKYGQCTVKAIQLHYRNCPEPEPEPNPTSN